MADQQVAVPSAPKVETFWEKTVRKCKAEPFVPIGALATVAFLGYAVGPPRASSLLPAVWLLFFIALSFPSPSTGFQAFQRGESVKAQALMRGRVLAQGFTIMVMSFGAFYGLKPHDRPKTYQVRDAWRWK